MTSGQEDRTPSERIRRRIDRYLDAADEAAARFDWAAARENAQAVLRLDPENGDAQVFLAGGDREPAAPAPAAPPVPPEPALVVREFG